MIKLLLVKNKSIAFTIILVIIISGIAFSSRSRQPHPPSVEDVASTSTTSPEQKPNILDDASEEELERYRRVYKNPYVIYLRKCLDAYLANDNSGVYISMAAVLEYHAEGITSGLDAFSKDYYRSKFVVVTINNSEGGEGKDIQIIFREKPDRVFYAWVYGDEGGNYELRGFNSKDYIDEDALKENLEYNAPLFYDPDLAL